MTDDGNGKKRLRRLQHQLNRIQQAYVRQDRRAVIVFEGWDAAGKGGVIRRIGWSLDPRPLKVWRIGAPDEGERRQHYLQRFWARMPRDGQWAVFDRSWYGRVLVERVEGLAEEEAWRRAYGEIVEFESTLIANGARLVKLFLDITPDTQLERFRNRYRKEAKRWKVTEEDLRNRARWDEYDLAYREMLERTSTDQAPWFRIDANSKRAARVECFERMIDVLGDGVSLDPPTPPALVRAFFEKSG